MDEIERLELRIEELREAIERSRRLRLAGRASAVIGPALLAGFALGLVAYTPTRMIVALALAIGGVVLTGSSRSSTEELERSLKQAEAERMAAIDALDLVQVGEGKGNVMRGGHRAFLKNARPRGYGDEARGRMALSIVQYVHVTLWNISTKRVATCPVRLDGATK